MYMKRKIDDFLTAWKTDRSKKPLIIKGPRQVGKTASIRHFAKNNYESIIEINFVEEPKYKMITSDGYKTEAIVKNISLLDPSKKFIPNKTLIFFDEIQEFPDIATSLKFFKEDSRFDIICSGSMLGINYKEIESNSVGAKTDYTMRSMDFEEFLWAKGYDDSFKNNLLLHMYEIKPFNELELTVSNSLFMDFCVLGGMPAVVSEYISNGTFEGTLDIQRQLLLDYKEDIQKYADGVDQTRILNVFNRIAPQLAKENKKFQISKVASGARFRDYRGCIDWLDNAGIINVCYCLDFPELPLKGNYDNDTFKLYFTDSGLLVAMLDDEAQDDLRANKNLGVYKGALYENIVGEAFVKAGCDLFYYKRKDSTLEQDFFLCTANNLVPIEVRSENKKRKSLKTLINYDKYEDVSFGIKLNNGNIGYDRDVYTFPYFCSFLVKSFLKQRF